MLGITVSPNYKRVIMIVADGARPDVMEELLAAGELPAINQYLIQRGGKRNVVTAFPSTTGPAYMPFLTGCLPATCNVPGIRWIDKVKYAKKSIVPNRYRSYVGFETFLIGHDMRRELPTLFELLPKSYNIFSPVNKGVGFFYNQTSMSRIWYWYYAHLTDRWSFVDKSAVKKAKGLIKDPFDMIFFVMPGIDEYSHIAHYRNDSTIEAYRRVDQGVNTICEELLEAGKLEDTLIWLVSDHGLSETHTHFCVNEFLESRGIRTFYYPKIYRKNCVAANMVSGNGMTNIYLSHDDGWQYPVYIDFIRKKYPSLIEDLVREEAVEILACRLDPVTIRVISKKGTADIHLDGDILKYTVHGSDPFGYQNIGGHVSAEALLEQTKDTFYPDAPYQLAHLFTSPRCGDIVLSATIGYDLRRDYEIPEHKGSHGSLHREHMAVPLISNAEIGSGICRTTDVFPTTLKLMNHPIPSNIDGHSLV